GREFDVRSHTVASNYEDSANTVTIYNQSKTPITLFPKTNLDVVVTWKEYKPYEVMNPAYKKPEQRGTKTRYHICGESFTLSPKQEITLFVCFTKQIRLSQNQLSFLNNGKRAVFKGVVVLEREMTEDMDIMDVMMGEDSSTDQVTRVAKTIPIQGFFGAPMGSVTPDVINVGKIGYDNEWRDVPIQFDLVNLTEASLVVRPENLPNFLRLQPDGRDEENLIRVESMQTKTVTGTLNTRNLYVTSGPLKIDIPLVNVYNPHNNLNLSVRGEVTTCSLKYSRLNEEGEITLPTLYHPSSQVSDNWFIVENTNDRKVDLQFQVDSSKCAVVDLPDYFQIEILTRKNNEVIQGEKRVSLAAGEATEILVRARCRDDRRLPKDMSSKEPDIVGDVCLSLNGAVIENIPIRMQLTKGETLCLSTTRLHFDFMIDPKPNHSTGFVTSECALPFSMTNPSLHFPVHYSLSLTQQKTFAPTTIKTSVLDPSNGVLQPGATAQLMVKVEATEPGSDSLTLVFADTESDVTMTMNIAILVKRAPEIAADSTLGNAIIMRRSTEETISILQPATSDQPKTVVTVIPRITLKGCTPVVNNRYEINLGQCVAGSGNITWEMIIENSSTITGGNSSDNITSVEYFIYLADPQHNAWISSSRNSGILETVGDSHSVTLTFSTKEPNIYHSYLVIQNKSNPRDFKTLQVSYRVMSAQNLDFYLLVDGKRSGNYTIDCGEVSFGRSYTRRSFVVMNDSPMPLEFLLTSSLEPDDPTEVNFSLSRNSLNLASSVNIGPKSFVRIFIHYNPLPSTTDEDVDEETYKENKLIKIYVSCSLIKDFHQTIVMKSVCSFPQLRVSHNSFVFFGSVDWHTHPHNESHVIDYSTVQLQFSQENTQQTVLITNQFSTAANLVVKNASMFFIVEGSEEQKIEGRTVNSLIIRPNIPIIMNNKKLLLKEKFIEEHVNLYNREKPNDSFIILLRITFGRLAKFHSAPGPRLEYPAQQLEGLVVNWLKDYHTYWMKLFHSFAERTNRKDITIMDAIVRLDNRLPDDSELYFMCSYITDELVFYGLRKHAGTWAFQLSNLLFSSMFRYESPLATILSYNPSKNLDRRYVVSRQNVLARWGTHLDYFLSYFPEPQPTLDSLRSLKGEVFIRESSNPAEVKPVDVTGSAEDKRKSGNR
ncbi:hypothetical protein PROFUN_05613, partial [Planoprotostelium fungivorum]